MEFVRHGQIQQQVPSPPPFIHPKKGCHVRRGKVGGMAILVDSFIFNLLGTDPCAPQAHWLEWTPGSC
jgi:hypothetical protein